MANTKKILYYWLEGHNVDYVAPVNSAVLVTDSGGIPSLSSSLPDISVAANISLAGNVFASSSVVPNYHIIYGPSGANKGRIAVGYTGDVSIYYDTTTHNFRSADGSVTFFRANAAGLNVLGSTSGVFTFAVPAIAGSSTLTFPVGTTNFTATGGVGQVVKQNSVGGAFTVGVPTGTTTNDNAATGAIGEYISSIVLAASEITLTSTVAANITSISLTAGDWDVSGTVWFDENGATVTTLNSAGITTTSATIPTVPADNTARSDISLPAIAGAFTNLPVGPARLSLAGTTTVYLIARSNFSINSNAAFGIIRARRVR
jgi:hypothetical protein